MSIPDSALEQWYELLLGRTPAGGLGPARGQARARPRADGASTTARRRRARGRANGTAFSAAGGQPSEIEEATFTATNGTVHLPALIAELFGLSRSEARRLIAQGAVSLDDVAVAEVDVSARGARRARAARRQAPVQAPARALAG